MNFSLDDSPLTETSLTREKMAAWVASQTNGTPSCDVYGKPSEKQMRELQNIRSLSRQLQENVKELETSVRIAEVENQAMSPSVPILDFSEDHEFVSANQLDNYYTEEDKIDAKEEEKQRLTKGKLGRTEIQSFWSGQCLFLTGGTGFLGKVLIEKLLRSCGDIDTIYMLIRPKKGKEPLARLHEFLDDFVFHKAHEVNPKGIHKVVPIVGDMAAPGLGISDADRKTLTSKVTVIINAAATVRFDESLPVAASINVRGTRAVIQLARECMQLKSFTHISTAFANTHVDYIEEKFYEAPLSVDALEAVSEIDVDILEKITPEILGKRPNTYCFTKAIAEEAVRKYGEGMPISIVRPAIVVSTYEEPVRGWTDSLYGPTGLMVGIGTGVIRTMYMDESKTADMVPVDYTVNAILAATYNTAKNFKENQTSHIPIYNYVSGARNPITWGDFIEVNRKHGIDKPTTKAVWYYGLNPTSNYNLFVVYNFFLHFLPALMIDVACAVTGRRRTMVKLYNKVMKLAHILFYFSTRCWRFSDANTRELAHSMSPADRMMFPFDIQTMDWDRLAETFLVGLRVYLVKDDLSTLPEARKKWNRLYYMHLTLKMVTLGLALSLIYFLVKNIISLVFGV